MVRVERACDVLSFVSAILALADARSFFDVATGFESTSTLAWTHLLVHP